MAVVNSLKIKVAYEDATSRNYTFTGWNEMQTLQIEPRIIAINEAISNGTSDGIAFKSVFVSNNGANAIGITEAKVITTEQEVIYSAS